MFQSAWYSLGRLLVVITASLILRMDILWKTARPNGPVILVANHPSTTDPALVTTLIPNRTSILINSVLFKVPLFGRSLRMSGHIPVYPGHGKAALDEAERVLKSGRSVVIFPEGEISPIEGGYRKARSGMARLALKTGAPVIPVGINIDREWMQLIETQVEGKPELGTWYFRGPYAMTVGEAMFFEGDPEDRERVSQVTGQIMHQIASLANESEYRILDAQYAANIPARLVNFGLRLMLNF